MIPEDVAAGTPMMLGCIPASTPENKRYAQRLGMGNTPFLRPYKGSASGKCMVCEGTVCIGPEQQKTLKAWPDTPIVCLICAGVAKALGNDAPVIKLSDKTTGH